MLDDAAIEHTDRAARHIAAAIAAAGGWLSFERYMDLALYAPGLGYYSAGAAKFGPGGDFVTAPEISRLFGGCLAAQCAQVLRALGQGALLELGAGSGRLAVDVLRALEARDCLPASYTILDVSADLRARQRRLLFAEVPHLAPRVQWLDAPPAGFDGVILANEVLDALPVTRFRWSARETSEWGVSVDAGRFGWALRPASPALAGFCAPLASREGWDDGST